MSGQKEQKSSNMTESGKKVENVNDLYEKYKNLSSLSFGQGKLDIPKRLKQKFRQNNLEWHFLSEARFNNEGRHDWRGFVPYRLEKDDLDGLEQASPDGYLKRGDAILAVRPKEVGKKHRDMIEERRQVFSAESKKTDIGREKLEKEAGEDSHILTGYDGKE